MGSLRIVGVLIIIFAIIGAWLFSMIKRGEKAQELESIIKEARKYPPFKIKGVYSSAGGRNDVDKLVKQAKEPGFNVIIWFVNPRWGQARYNTSYFLCGAQCKADLLSYLVKRTGLEKGSIGSRTLGGHLGWKGFTASCTCLIQKLSAVLTFSAAKL